MKRRLLTVLPCLGIAACLLATAGAQAPAVPDALAIYAKAILAMNAQPLPLLTAYNETVTPKGLDLRVIQVRGEGVIHLAYSSDKTVQVFHVKQSAAQHTAEIVDAGSGRSYIAERPFWSAVSPPARADGSTPTPADRTTVISTVREKLLADLLASTDGAYTVSFVGAENLDGSPVYHLHFVATQDAAVHPLADAFVDRQSFLVRRATANFTDRTVTDVTGVLSLNFGPVEKFWLVTSGEVDATVHAYFRKVSGSATFAATDVIFPSA
ncbi:MAG TPA: hypothetical protein VIJ12_08325 [Candidatus Baltobacteraceae bacterium]